MRSRYSIVLAALLGVLALSAVASASASASTCTKKEGSKNYQLCAAGHSFEETASIEAATTLSGNFVLELPKEWEASIVCTAATNASAFNTHGLKASVSLSIGSLSLSGCTLQGRLALKCGIETTIHTSSISGIFASPEEILMTPGEVGSYEFFTFLDAKNPGNCPIFFVRGPRVVHGLYECKLQEAKVEAVEHQLKCATTATRRLETQGEVDSLSYTQTISLGGTRKGQKFSIYEGA
jgi:hypothetical protein